MPLLIQYILVLSLSAFILTAYDKYLAVNHKKRISEKTLLTFALIGGTIGSLLAMFTFRHKTSKKSFLLKFITIVTIQLILVYFLYQNQFITIF